MIEITVMITPLIVSGSEIKNTIPPVFESSSKVKNPEIKTVKQSTTVRITHSHQNEAINNILLFLSRPKVKA